MRNLEQCFRTSIVTPFLNEYWFCLLLLFIFAYHIWPLLCSRLDCNELSFWPPVIFNL